jgi:hypothetical protein
MVHFYKPEIMTILRSEDAEVSVRKLYDSKRRILSYDSTLTRYEPEITKSPRTASIANDGTLAH